VIWRPKDGDRHLERQVGTLLSDARAAGDRGDLEGQVRLSGEAMDICRGLLERHPGDPRHLGALAGGLYNHAYRLIEVDRIGDARDVLAESRRHYTTLNAATPHRYEVALCDVRLRTALTFVLEGRYDEGERQAREALAAYGEADTDDELERAFGELRAHSLIGRALLLGGRPDEALQEFDTALFAGEQLRQAAGISGTDFDWLARAPASFRLAAPEWLGSAVAAMELHDAAGAWHIAADAANVAMRVGGGLAMVGEKTASLRFAAIEQRAQVIWWSAQNPAQAAAQRGGPTQELRIGGGAFFRGPRPQLDLARISRLAGWGPLPAG
jgi:tetratricopeptide (TPR) repeat protein